MPNHITNIITITAPENRTAQEVIDFVKTESRLVDFNTAIPMPQDAIDSFDTPGISPLWYRWSVENWGTKWNAYHTSVDGNVVQFDTAWSAPMPVFYALRKKFPDFTFDIKYADEDYGQNFGHFRFDSDGIHTPWLPEPGTPQARVWVFQNVIPWPEDYDEQGNSIHEDDA